MLTFDDSVSPGTGGSTLVYGYCLLYTSYSNREIPEFHRRQTVQGERYNLMRMNFAKRCCSDDANLCEILEINAGSGKQSDECNCILNANEFQTQYRKQLEKTSADGTVAVSYTHLDVDKRQVEQKEDLTSKIPLRNLPAGNAALRLL